MLQQGVMIEKVRELCRRDERVVATLTYGSFALPEALLNKLNQHLPCHNEIVSHGRGESP